MKNATPASNRRPRMKMGMSALVEMPFEEDVVAAVVGAGVSSS
jgi:hypothetical protein